MASMLISDLIPLLEQPGLMLEMEEAREKMLNFFVDIQPKLRDAQVRAECDPSIRTWLVDLEAMAYDADNIVYDLRNAKLEAEAEAEGCWNQNDDRVRVGMFSCFKIISINLPFFNEWPLSNGALGGIGNRIGSVVNKIDDLVHRMTDLNSEIVTERQQQLIFTSPTEIDDIFVGRDGITKDIVKLLVQPNGTSRIIIQGPQGRGKTALVRFICKNVEINNRFECVIWVEVGSKFNIGNVAKSIIDQVIGKDCCIPESNTYLLELRLYQELTGKRYIIVLDDVWVGCGQLLFLKFDEWIGLTDVFASSLIVTSRFAEVAQMLQRGDPYELQPLMYDDGWNLFCRKAFSNNVCPEILKEMGQKIVVKCGGSPLAVNMMGGLMRFKKGREEWEGVINQLESYIGNYEVTVETTIKVCYHYLCSQVKQCFALCSLFPKSYYMDKEVLIKLWMANGLLLPSDELTPPEEMGNIVFNELASRHFFENVKLFHEDSYKNKHGYHSRVTFKMLDLVQEQAIIAAREFSPLISISGDSRVDIPVLLETNPAVHILLSPDEPFIRKVNCSVVPKKNSLRALHLQSVLFERDILELKHMTHLRYLDLSRSTIKTLPEATSLLFFLQTLNLSKCLLLEQLPKNMKYMRSLRHLYIHKCPKLKKMPAHFRQLGNLHTLSTYIVGEESAGTGIDEIKDMKLSGLLELYCLCMVETAAIAKEANLVLKTNLDRLTLCWGSEQLVMSEEKNDLEVLEALQPHMQLKVLKIQQYGSHKLATWLANPVSKDPINLVELHLICCPQCHTLPALWKLSSLRVLCMKHMPNLSSICHNYENQEWEIFIPSLKRLVLVDMKRLDRWHENGAIVTFTVLDELEITGCPKLTIMPHVPQLKHITASIENYSLLESVINLVTQPESLVEEANIAKASNANNEPFPSLISMVEDRINYKLRIMQMDSTNSVFMPTALPSSLLGLWKPFKLLQYLDIFNCDTLVFWPLEFTHLEGLIRLSIRRCPNLTGKLPAQPEKGKMQLPQLQKLEFYECSSLKQVPNCIGSLNVLELDECPEVESVAGIVNLGMLYLSCTSWTSLPRGLGDFKWLHTLWVSECYSLMCLPDELAHTYDVIKTLVINECPMVKELPRGHWLRKLNKLQISKCPDLEKFCKERPYSCRIPQILLINASSRFDPTSY